MGEALVVNPTHNREIGEALQQALGMPAEEQIKRNQTMQERLRRYDVVRWADDFSQALVDSQHSEAATHAHWLTGKAQTGLIQHYRSAARRALVLDYDGTLVPFAATPKQARPDHELPGLLAGLASDPANAVAIVSGRTRADLDEWFGALPLTLVAEHGVWLKYAGTEWRQLKSVVPAWKDQLRPILQLHVDRLPGAQLEEKEFGLAFHYRRADPEQASVRAKELLDDLADYTRNIEVQVLIGNKVVELRNIGINKGTGAMEWLATVSPDFILAIGDDWTDEDLFRALPPSAFSVRIGLANTAARFHLSTHTAVRRILRELAQTRPETRVAVTVGSGDER
jgi:trehalose 6-phosphate synthase/phosphatase